MTTKSLRRFLAWFIFTVATAVIFFLGIIQGFNFGGGLVLYSATGAARRPALAPREGGLVKAWRKEERGVHVERRTRVKIEPRYASLRKKHLDNPSRFRIFEDSLRLFKRAKENLTRVQLTLGPCDGPLKIVPADRGHATEITRAIRNHTIHAICQAEKINNISMLDPAARKALAHQIIVDDERKFLYCYVPKVACSNWKRVIKFMQGNIEDIGAKLKMDHKNGLVFLDTFSEKEIQHRIRTYFKFMFVRDPIERLLSAFRNKFGAGALDAYKERYAPKIIETYRGRWDGKDKNITIEEFMRFIIDKRTRTMDLHWKPMHLLCQPCAVQYDFVGSFEQLSEDANYVLDKIKGNTGAYFPSRQKWYDPTTDDKVEALINEVDPVYIQQIVDKYILDFITFGYAPPKQYYLKYNQVEKRDVTKIDPRGSSNS